MPVVGEFHRFYWRSRANPVTPPGQSSGWMYPGVQSVVTMMSVIGWISLEPVRPWWRRLRAVWAMAAELWGLSDPERARLAGWLHRLQHAPADQQAVYDRVAAIMEGPWWNEANERVRGCATTPKFHQPEQWVAYGRALKANAGQAQNVFRHVKVVHELRAFADEHQMTISNPDAHLVTELAYQAFAAIGH